MNLIERFIQQAEGYAKRLPDGSCTTYLCSAKVLTIGFGSTGRGVTPGVIWTRQQAEIRFQQDLTSFSKGVFALSPSLQAETAGKQAAIISFAYNLGLNSYKNSTLRRTVERQDWDETKRQLMRWVRAGNKEVKGLVLRRQAECALIDLK